MLRGKVPMGSAAIVLWSCSGIWWMCAVWAGAYSSVHPPTPFLLFTDTTSSTGLAAAGNKSLSYLLDSAAGLSDIDKENTVNVMHELKTDQYRNAMRNSKNRNGNIFNGKARISSIHAVPYNGMTKNFHTTHDKIRHFLKRMGSYGIGRYGFFVSQENKLNNISSLEHVSEMGIGNTKQSIAVRFKYSNRSPTTSADSTSETSFTNNSLDHVNFCDGHTLYPKRMNYNITVENTAIFRYSEYPPKKSNQMCIYDLDGSNCLVNTSKTPLHTHLHVHISLPSTNSSINCSRCVRNVSHTAKETENVKHDSKSDKARDNEQKRLNFTLNVVSQQISSDFMKSPLNFTDHLARKWEQIEADKYSKDKTLETLKNELKTRRNEVHHDHMDIHETSSLNQHGDDDTGDDDSYSRYKALGRTTKFKKANRTSDLQHEGQDTVRKIIVRELRGLNSPIVMRSWHVKQNSNESVSDLMNNKNNIKLMDKYWQPMWYNVR